MLDLILRHNGSFDVGSINKASLWIVLPDNEILYMAQERQTHPLLGYSITHGNVSILVIQKADVLMVEVEQRCSSMFIYYLQLIY